jgi:phosphatidylglycerol---prolipoprotein diacylglyceryl transferase
MDPIFVTIGPLELRWYGVLIALGVVAGTVWAVRAAKRRGLDPDWLLDTAPWMVVAGLVGARLVYVLTSPAAFFGPAGDPIDAFKVWQGGVSIHGGVGGAILALMYRARAKGYDTWRYLDVLMPVMAFGIIGGRLGNLMNGTDTGGRLTSWGIGFTWPEPGTPTFGALGRLVFGDPLWQYAPPACWAPMAAGEPCVVHLTPIYGAVVGVALLGVIVWGLRSARSHGGVALHSLLWYSVLRSVIEEPFRDNPLPWPVYLDPVGGVGLLTATQLASVPIVLVLVYLLVTRPSKEDDRPAVLATAPARRGGARGRAERDRRSKGR